MSVADVNELLGRARNLPFGEARTVRRCRLIIAHARKALGEHPGDGTTAP